MRGRTFTVVALAAALAGLACETRPGAGDPDGAIDDGSPDATDGLPCRCERETEICVVEYTDLMAYPPGSCVEVPAGCTARDFACIAGHVCGGRPSSWISDSPPFEPSVWCFPSRSRPCPYYDAGMREGFHLCGPTEACVGFVGGECYARCIELPAECRAAPACACAGPELCGPWELEGDAGVGAADSRCRDAPGCANAALECDER